MSDPFKNPYFSKPAKLEISRYVNVQDMLKLKSQIAKLKMMGWPTTFNQIKWNNETQRREMVEMLRMIEITLEKNGCDPKKFSIDFNSGKIIPIDSRIIDQNIKRDFN